MSELILPGGNGDGIKWLAYAKASHYHPDTTAAMTKLLGYEPKGADLARLARAGKFLPDEEYEAFGNLLTTAGLNRLTKLITGTGTAFTNAFGIIGVGATSTAATVSDTVLGADAGSAWYQGLDATYPTQANGLITANATFASANGNFAWNEWCWGIVTSGTVTGTATFASTGTTPQILNHKVQSMGSKVSGGVSTLNSTITLS